MFGDGAITTQGLESLVDALRHVDENVGDAERVDQLAALERVKAAASAAQARVTAAFVESQAQVAEQWLERAGQCSAAGDFEGWRVAREQARRATFEPGGRAAETAAGGGRRARRRATVHGVAAQVALARRESPSRGSHHVNLALRLVHEMPHTLAALEAGLISEWRATIISRETAQLDTTARALVDAEISSDPERLGRLGSWGDRELARRVRAVAYRIDPASVLARCTAAQADRRVTIRPAPDTMPT